MTLVKQRKASHTIPGDVFSYHIPFLMFPIKHQTSSKLFTQTWHLWWFWFCVPLRTAKDWWAITVADMQIWIAFLFGEKDWLQECRQWRQNLSKVLPDCLSVPLWLVQAHWIKIGCKVLLENLTVTFTAQFIQVNIYRWHKITKTFCLISSHNCICCVQKFMLDNLCILSASA